jgi:hypothetical protein
MIMYKNFTKQKLKVYHHSATIHEALQYHYKGFNYLQVTH